MITEKTAITIGIIIKLVGNKIKHMNGIIDIVYLGVLLRLIFHKIFQAIVVNLLTLISPDTTLLGSEMWRAGLTVASTASTLPTVNPSPGSVLTPVCPPARSKTAT